MTEHDMTILGVLLAGTVLGGGLVLILWVWSAYVTGARQADAMDRYFRKQQVKAQLCGCATPVRRPQERPDVDATGTPREEI